MPKCTLKYALGFRPHHLEQTDIKFKYSLELGESRYYKPYVRKIT